MWAWSPVTCADCALLGAYIAHDVLRASARARVTLALGLSAVRTRQVLSAEHRDDGDLRHDLDVSSRGPYRGAAGAISKAVLGRLPEVREVGTRAGLLGAESGEMDKSCDNAASVQIGAYPRSSTAAGDVLSYAPRGVGTKVRLRRAPMVAAATTLEYHDGEWP